MGYRMSLRLVWVSSLTFLEPGMVKNLGWAVTAHVPAFQR